MSRKRLVGGSTDAGAAGLARWQAVFSTGSRPNLLKGAARTTSALDPLRARPVERPGQPSAGRIVMLYVGQSHGFIRLPNERDVFFHRSDMRDGTSFNDLEIGDAVCFELLQDRISGPRARQVERRRPRR